MDNNFGNMVVLLRQNKNMSQQKLANELGLSQSQINKIEHGYIVVNFATIIKLAKFFNVTTDYLLGVEPVKKNIPETEFTQEQQQVVELVKKLNSNELEKIYNYLLGLLDARN